MKYGKNQWVRISSLLVPKSAKQCRSRWYESHDPSIEKTEWTREEDEKLLHFAKLLPTQWRTITSIVGRTSSQCLNRYEKLLDAAYTTKEKINKAADDAQKLRPGEIDPSAESKPLCPDPVDMDENEKEMLSEARARLANTRGKKAKRKAREKQLEEARRLASLQKRRELKAVGFYGSHRKMKRIDYNVEIPFEMRASSGFYDTAGEDRLGDQVNFLTNIEELERKSSDVEAQLRKQDVARNKQDAPAAILQANKLNDPEARRKGSKLMLPPPQISDNELEDIAKMGYASDLLAENEELTGVGCAATHALLANNSQTPKQGMTSMGTPQRSSAGKVDAIMTEAENQGRLRDSQTCLLGGENPELHPSGFSGVTPRKKEIQTPNPMLTRSMIPGGDGLTPRSDLTPSRDGSSFAMTPKETPLRDELHINEDLVENELQELSIANPSHRVWTAEKDNELVSLWSSGKDIEDISKRVGRTMDVCSVRLVNLGCEMKEKVVVVSEERVFVLKILCPRERVNPRFLQKIDRICNENAVHIDTSPFDDDNEYIVISISATEVFESDSQVPAAALKLFKLCVDTLDKPKLKRLIVGTCRIRLITDNLKNFSTSFVMFF